MSNLFTYSVLQYKHSLALSESINVGLLFYFPNDNDRIHFVPGNTQRVRCVYPSFDIKIYSIITKHIKEKISSPKSVDLFEQKQNFEFSKYITSNLIPEDSTSLQFSEPYTAVNYFGTSTQAIEEYSKVLLPQVEIKREENRHDEPYILKKYTDYITQSNIIIEHKMSRNKFIESHGVKLNFELAWKNGTTHLVKPVSFDLKEEKDIQNKSVTYFGYLDLLDEYANINGCVFDLLVSQPQNEKLHSSYHKALEVLNRATAPKEIVTEENLSKYSQDTVDVLLKKTL